jgi:hypothetical protein
MGWVLGVPVLDPADVEHGAVEVDLPKGSESEQ